MIVRWCCSVTLCWLLLLIIVIIATLYIAVTDVIRLIDHCYCCCVVALLFGCCYVRCCCCVTLLLLPLIYWLRCRCVVVPGTVAVTHVAVVGLRSRYVVPLLLLPICYLLLYWRTCYILVTTWRLLIAHCVVVDSIVDVELLYITVTYVITRRWVDGAPLLFSLLLHCRWRRWFTFTIAVMGIVWCWRCYIVDPVVVVTLLFDYWVVLLLLMTLVVTHCWPVTLLLLLLRYWWCWHVDCYRYPFVYRPVGIIRWPRCILPFVLPIYWFGRCCSDYDCSLELRCCWFVAVIVDCSPLLLLLLFDYVCWLGVVTVLLDPVLFKLHCLLRCYCYDYNCIVIYVEFTVLTLLFDVARCVLPVCPCSPTFAVDMTLFDIVLLIVHSVPRRYVAVVPRTPLTSYVGIPLMPDDWVDCCLRCVVTDLFTFGYPLLFRWRCPFVVHRWPVDVRGLTFVVTLLLPFLQLLRCCCYDQRLRPRCCCYPLYPICCLLLLLLVVPLTLVYVTALFITHYLLTTFTLLCTRCYPLFYLIYVGIDGRGIDDRCCCCYWRCCWRCCWWLRLC